MAFKPTPNITQNKGTLMTASHALEMPVLSLGSGPTNSMRGACSLAGLADAISVDVCRASIRARWARPYPGWMSSWPPIVNA